MAESGANIDSLNIQVEANAKTAETSLDSLLAGLKDVVSELKEMTSALRSQTKASKDSQPAVKEVAKETQKLSETTKKAAGTIGKLFKSLGRIAFYRAIRTAIKNVSAAIREGLTNLYAYSQEFGTAFAPAVDSLRQHVLLLKNAFATALRPAIEAIIPLIIQLVDALSHAADFVAQVTSVLFGKTDENGRYTKAILGDLEQSNEQAKELRRTLLGFDEINRLDGDTGSGKSTSTGANFVQADVSDSAKGVAEFIKNIDWDTVIDVLKPVGIAIAAFKAAKFVSSLTTVGKVIGSIAKFIGGIVSAHPVIAAIVAALAVLSQYGQDIQDFLDRFQVKADTFLDDLQNKVSSKFLKSVIQTARDIFDTVSGVISSISGAVYKLFHGDFSGFLADLVRLVVTIGTGIANIIIDVLNIILGAVSDNINNILKAVTWLWNEGIQPILDPIVHCIWNKVLVPIQNGVITLVVGFLAAIKDGWNVIADFLNDKLNSVIEMINGVLLWINEQLGWSIPTIPLDVIPRITDESIMAIEATKFKPIEEEVEIVPKIKEAPQIDLRIKAHLDAKEISDWANNLLGLVKQTVSNVNTTVLSGMNQMRQNAPQKQFANVFASGGFPTAGSMFIAGEAGPELVANIGGQTGVWNSDQLVQGMFNAFSAALAANPQGGGDIYLDGEVIYRNTVRRNNNAVRATGRSALLT